MLFCRAFDQLVAPLLPRIYRVELGYRSASVDHAYVLLGVGVSDRNMAYVQLTRGKESTHLFVDELSAGPNLEQLAKTISKQRTKTIAHELAHNIEHDISR